MRREARRPPAAPIARIRISARIARPPAAAAQTGGGGRHRRRRVCGEVCMGDAAAQTTFAGGRRR
eukprot:gene16161-51661_t